MFHLAAFTTTSIAIKKRDCFCTLVSFSNLMRCSQLLFSFFPQEYHHRVTSLRARHHQILELLYQVNWHLTAKQIKTIRSYVQFPFVFVQTHEHGNNLPSGTSDTVLCNDRGMFFPPKNVFFGVFALKLTFKLQFFNSSNIFFYNFSAPTLEIK